MLALPDCERIVDFSIELSGFERSELIQRLAVGGSGEVSRFVGERKDGDSEIARRIEMVRDILRRQADELVEEISSERQRRKRLLEGEHRKKGLELEAKENGYRESQSEMEERLQGIIDQAFLSDDAVKLIIDLPEGEEKAGLWDKIKIWLRKAGVAVRRFFRWLGKKLGLIKEEKLKKEYRVPSILIRIPSLRGLDGKLGNALVTSKDLQRKIDSRIMKRGLRKRISLFWEKYFDRERYKRDALRALSEEIEDKVKEERKDLDEEVRTLREELEKISEERRKLDKHLEKEGKRIDDSLEAEIKRIERELKERPRKILEDEIRRSLEEAGYLKRVGSDFFVTSQLVDRFAEIVFGIELQNLPMPYRGLYGTTAEGSGIFERGKMRTVQEISRMDIVESMVHARVNHPRDRHISDEDIFINREIRTTRSHVVLVFDKSGSMEENNRMEAAKKAVLALYKAVTHRDSNNTVDLVAFDTRVQVMDLLQVWKSEPDAFTNTGEALRVAYHLLKDSRADRKMVYLITDGLPEAYTEDGVEYAGDMEKSMDYALSYAKELGEKRDIYFTMILLEPKDRMYVDAAVRIARTAGGKAVITDPNQLAKELMVDYVAV